jgi:hypothetical protein
MQNAVHDRDRPDPLAERSPSAGISGGRGVLRLDMSGVSSGLGPHPASQAFAAVSPSPGKCRISASRMRRRAYLSTARARYLTGSTAESRSSRG